MANDKNFFDFIEDCGQASREVQEDARFQMLMEFNKKIYKYSDVKEDKENTSGAQDLSDWFKKKEYTVSIEECEKIIANGKFINLLPRTLMNVQVY